VNRHEAVALAAIALDDLRGLCALQQPGLDENFKRTFGPLRGLVRAEDFLSRIGAAKPLKDVFEQAAFRHAPALPSLAGSLGSMPESASDRR
jgi:hypothetical protein